MGGRNDVGGALLVAGTNSDAGKSALTAGLCRWFARQGVKVAPFKAQNMSLNSFVTADGAEIARSQVVQAAAAGIEPTVDMNPILLKPGSDRRSQVIVRGHPVDEADALEYRKHAPRLRKIALESLQNLRSRYDVVICEGAGSPAEINLRQTDIANMGLAREANLPVIVVGDIDRGGVFAAMYGTLALLSPQDQALISGFVINKFRGAPELLDSGLTMLTELTGRPVLGVLPWRNGLWIDAEDSLGLPGGSYPPQTPPAHGGPARPPVPPGGDPRSPITPWGPAAPWAPQTTEEDTAYPVLNVTVLRFPRISNFTDIDALIAEPGVRVRFTDSPAGAAAADLLVLPGTRATVADLQWLRDRGFEAVISERTRAMRPVLGICGGYQMLADFIDDDIESGAGRVHGLGVLPTHVRFGIEKQLRRPTGTAYGEVVRGYEIRHGVVTLDGRDGRAGRGGERKAEPFLADGCRVGAVWGTSWHGTLENDGFRRAFLAEVAALAASAWRPAPDTDFAALREARLDVLGDLVAEHLDMDAVTRLISDGAPLGLPVLPR